MTGTYQMAPAAVFVAEHRPGSPEWHEQRRQGIGSSDIPQILGLSSYGNARTVYHVKRGDVEPDEAGEPARWGNLLEAVIADEFAYRNDMVVWPVGTLANVDEPWMLANLDRLARGCPGPVTCAVEIKNRNAWTAGQWRHDVPDDVLAQVQWQLAVTGLPHMHVAALVGGNELVTHVVEPEPDVIAYIVAAARQVWQCVLDGTPPAVDPDAALAALLERMHPHRDGDADLPDDEANALIERYERARVATAELEAEQKAARAGLLDLLGGAEVGWIGGREAVRYRQTSRRSPDLKALKADFPDAYAACVRETTSRRFEITRQFRYPEE